MIVIEGSTNVSVPFYFVDDAGGTTPGEPTTGLLFSDIETGGSASYQRQGAARTDFTLVTLASASAAHSDGGFILVDDTEMPGVYRCDIPDAAVAAGVDFVIVYLRAAAAKNTITRPLKIDLVADLDQIASDAIVISSDTAVVEAWGLSAVASDTAAIEVDTGTTLSAQITTIASDVVLIYSDTTLIEGWGLGSVASDTAAIEVDTSTTLSAQITTIASDVVEIYSDTTIAEDTLVLASGTSDSGSTTTMVDAARTEADDDYWNGKRILFTSGTIDGQVREITDFVAATDTITFSPATTQAVATQTYRIIPGVAASGLTAGQASDLVAIESELIKVYSDTTVVEGWGLGSVASDTAVIETSLTDNNLDHLITWSGTATAAGTTTTLVDTALTQADDYWNGMALKMTGGPNIHLVRAITDFDAATDTITVSPAFPSATGTNTYVILNASDATITGTPDVNLAQISGDATAADNLEAMLDGTGGVNLTLATMTVTTNAISWNSSWDAEVESECNDALIGQGLDHLLAASVIGTDVVDNSVLARLVSASATADWDDYVNTTDSLQAISDRATTIASDVVLIYSDTTAIEAGGGGLTAAQASDLVAIESELIKVYSDTTVIEASGGGLTAAQASDLVAIESELIKVYSDTTVVEAWGLGSVASDTAAIETDTGTTLSAQITTIASDVVLIYSDTTSLEVGQPIRDAMKLAPSVGAASAGSIDLRLKNTEQSLVQVATTIATLASQTSFTLTAGSADDNAYKGSTIVIRDALTSNQIACGVIDSYTGSTKTVTLLEDPGVFTMAVTDVVYILTDHGLKPTNHANYHFDATAVATIASDTAAIEVDTGTTLSAQITTIASDIVIVASDVLVIDGVSWYPKYNGPRGPGVYLNDAAANTNTTNGTDGTINNPVSTIAAAKTIADSLSFDRIYLVNDSDITLAATMTDYEFVGIGETTANVVNLGSQDVSNSSFYNLAIEGTQGGSGRILAVGCALQDPGAGDTTLHIFACQCGIVDRIQVDTSADNVFDSCYSLVAGTTAPIIQATGASGTISVRHFSGGIEFETLSASHNVSVETDGQVVFAADCNVNATVVLRGNLTITDNTAGMASLTTDAVYDKRAQITTIASDLVIVASDLIVVSSDTALISRTAMTEAYAADATAFTMAQYAYMSWSYLHDFGISGTTKTSRKLDNTTAMTHTIDDATDPTDITRAT